MFKTVTLRFSSDTPSLPSVIPAMDNINATLEDAIANPKYNAAIRASLQLGKDLLNKYYSLTDESSVYRIAMSMSSFTLTLFPAHNGLIVLHPSYKLRYFEKMEWSEEWKDEALRLIHEEFDDHYAVYEPTVAPTVCTHFSWCIFVLIFKLIPLGQCYCGVRQ